MRYRSTPPLSSGPRELAMWALGAIGRQDKGHVWASRRGVVAGTPWREEHYLIFRRDDEGSIELEVWRAKTPSEIRYLDLPPDLEEAAGHMLDSL